MSTPKGAAGVIATLLARAGLGLPVRLRTWDGSEAGPAGAPVLVARSPRALQRILWRPGELGLARAYVSGDLDVEGDLTDALRRVRAARPRPLQAGTALAAIQAAARLNLLAPPPDPPRCELQVRGRGPFIESYIAPDMDMRPVGDTIKLIQGAGFEVIGVEAMREHYVRTIRAWLDNFERNLPAIAGILSAEQVRVWRLYLAGGALAFEQGRMGVDQILAVRPVR